MKPRLYLRVGVLNLIALTAALAQPPQQVTQDAAGKRTPVVVELFTSEGCSSCPPADELLARLARTQPVGAAQIIALKEHVDYWDHQGWRDPFSSAQFTERQSSYADAFGNHQVYTPQMVVDGRAEFTGSAEQKAKLAIAEAARAPKAAVSLEWRPASGAAASVPLEVRVDLLGQLSAGNAGEVYLAITEDNLHSDVQRGENAGRKLDHFAVVRELKQIGKANAKAAFVAAPAVKITGGWKRENLRAVVFVQESRTRRIVGAAEIRVPLQ